MEPTSWTYLMANLGFPITLAIVLLVWIRHIHKESIEREIRLGARIDELENRDRSFLVDLATESTAAIKESYRASRRVTNSLDELIRLMGLRFCLDDDSFWPHPSIRAHHGMPKPQSPSGETTQETTRNTPRKEPPDREISPGLKPHKRGG